MMRFWMMIAAVVMAAGFRAEAAASSQPPMSAPAPLRVLFIGNSFTYYNGLPSMVAAMFAARKQALQAEMHAVGAATLGLHAANPKVAQLIAGSRWDYVVLQDQSALPASRPDETLNQGTKLCACVRKAGATPVFFLTWAYRNEKGAGMDGDMQDRLNAAYCAAAKANHALLAPVGPAWQSVLAKEPKAALYAGDGIHPSSEGTYLAACVFYAVLAKQSPVGLPGRLTDTQGGRRVILADVPAARAKLFQQTAWGAAQGAIIEKLTAAHDRKEAVLPSVDDVKAKLKKTMRLAELCMALGAKPNQANEQQKLYLFKLRNGAMLWVNYGGDGAIAKCTVVPENGGPWIAIELK